MRGGQGLNPTRFEFANKLKVSIDFSQAAWNTVATHEVFNVTGLVRALVIYQVTANLTSGGAATVSFGDDQGAANYSAAQAYTNLTSPRVVVPGGTISVVPRWWSVYQNSAQNSDNVFAGVDIGYQIATAAMTGGTIVAYCFWTPISDDGLVVAGDGSAL